MRSLLVLTACVVGASALPAAAAERAAPHPLMKLAHKAGADLGLGAGVVVTAGLGLSKTWSAPLDKGGAQETIDVKGFHYGLEVRNQSVVGPKVEAYASKMPTRTAPERLAHAFVEGVAKGATAAPMKEAYLEGTLARLFAKRATAQK